MTATSPAPLDAAYVRAVFESREDPARLDDALGRIAAGCVEPSTFYRDPSGLVGTPLTFAVRENEVVLVDALLARGADANARRVDPATNLASPPILFGIRSTDVLRRLVAGGARLDAGSLDGETFLQHCARMTRVSGHPLWLAAATAAVELGADPRQRNDAGQDAATFAASMGARIGRAYVSLFGAQKLASPPPNPSAKQAPKKRRRVTR